MPRPVDITVEAIPFRAPNGVPLVELNIYSATGCATYYLEAPHLKQVAAMLITEADNALKIPNIVPASAADLKALENGKRGKP